MMKTLVRILPFVLTLISASLSQSCKTPSFSEEGELVDHDMWDSLLQKHVNEIGLVDYEGFVQDKAALETYLDKLSMNPPEGAQWTEVDKLAYWINAYNAFTVKLIVDNYPTSSIKDIKKGIPFINSVWDIKFFQIANLKMDLTTIEHGILRKVFDEPRIHFAINCASMSCPNLYDQAYTSDKLNEQLDFVTRQFINDQNKNVLSPDKIQISKIFAWFKSDFTENGSLIDFINRYSVIKISSSATIDHLDYDWSLNVSKKDPG